MGQDGLFGVTAEEVLAELTREAGQRQRVYARAVVEERLPLAAAHQRIELLAYAWASVKLGRSVEDPAVVAAAADARDAWLADFEACRVAFLPAADRR